MKKLLWAVAIIVVISLSCTLSMAKPSFTTHDIIIAGGLLAAVKNTGHPAEGEPIYAAQCARCHGDAGLGIMLLGGPRLAGTTFIQGDAAPVKEVITNGSNSDPLYPLGMPAFAFIESELNSIVAYLRSLPFTVTENYTVSCAYCHGVAGNGTKNGPVLAGSDFVHGTAAAIKDVIANGRAGADRQHLNFLSGMAGYAFTESELTEMAAYLKSFTPTVGDPVRGASLYLSKCAACHGATGLGTPLAPSLAGTTFIQGNPAPIKDVIITGRSVAAKQYPQFALVMPAFTFTDADRDAIVAYLQSL